jgi:hypothetical protein
MTGRATNGLKGALALSLLLNVGVLAGAGYAYWQRVDAPPSLPDYLALSTAQRQQWSAAEAGFADTLAEVTARIGERRERMLRAILADSPDRNAIEAERAAIASLQQEQQQRVIEQLLREGKLLDAGQRARLAELLLREMPATSPDVERLHRR